MDERKDLKKEESYEERWIHEEWKGKKGEEEEKEAKYSYK